MIKDLKGKLESGEIDQGENVVPRTYTVVKLTNSDLIVEEKTVQGRKIPLERMRKRLLKRHMDRGLMREPLISDSRDEILKYLKKFNISFNDNDDTETLKVTMFL